MNSTSIDSPPHRHTLLWEKKKVMKKTEKEGADRENKYKVRTLARLYYRICKTKNAFGHLMKKRKVGIVEWNKSLLIFFT